MSGPFDDEDAPTQDDAEEGALARLGDRFMAALASKDAGKLDEAEEQLRAILRDEPRLGEPHLELARLLLDTDRLGPAEEHAREAIEHLDRAGAWVDGVPENVVKGLAHAVLAEVLRRHADEDDVIFGDPAQFRAIVDESRREFAQAHLLDPSDDYASYHAFFLGLAGHGGTNPTEEDA